MKLAERYSQQGLPTTPEQIFVTSGSQSAISLAARTFIAPGDRVIVETPGYPHALNALRGAGGRLLPFRVDADAGWDVDGFELIVRRSLPTLAFLMPDFHNPTSRSMSVDERHRVVATAEAHGIMLVSDEATADLAARRSGSGSAHRIVRAATGHGAHDRFGEQDRVGRTSRGMDPNQRRARRSADRGSTGQRPRCCRHRSVGLRRTAERLRPDPRVPHECPARITRRAAARPPGASAVVADEPDPRRHRLLGAHRRTRELEPSRLRRGLADC